MQCLRNATEFWGISILLICISNQDIESWNTTIFEFKAVNITLGLPFLKITPDHGPNYKMIGKNQSDPSSIFYAFEILNNIKWNLLKKRV